MDDALKVADALKAFYGAEHLSDEAFTARVNYVDLGVIKLPFPNPKQRRDLVHLHDLNHVLTGYDTSFAGEGEVAGWELASGFPPRCWIAWFYTPLALLAGLVVAPRRVYWAYLRGRGFKNACFVTVDKEELMNLTVGELRAHLGHAEMV